MGQGLLKRVPGSELGRLLHKVHSGMSECARHLLPAMPIDDADARRSQSLGGIDDMRKERPPGETVQDLRPRRVHALALSRCKDDNVECHRGIIAQARW